MEQAYLYLLALLDVLYPLLLATCSLYLKRTLATYHILGSVTTFVAVWISIKKKNLI